MKCSFFVQFKATYGPDWQNNRLKEIKAVKMTQKRPSNNTDRVGDTCIEIEIDIPEGLLQPKVEVSDSAVQLAIAGLQAIVANP